MGTRAQFFVGNPMDLENRKWLGTVAFDGCPDGDVGDHLDGADSEKNFISRVAEIAMQRDDFCDPAQHSFPFPWKGNLFLTDYTYAFFDGAVQFTRFHTGFVGLSEYRNDTSFQNEYDEREDALPDTIPAPISDFPKGPDSIVIVPISAQ